MRVLFCILSTILNNTWDGQDTGQGQTWLETSVIIKVRKPSQQFSWAQSGSGVWDRWRDILEIYWATWFKTLHGMFNSQTFPLILRWRWHWQWSSIKYFTFYTYIYIYILVTLEIQLTRLESGDLSRQSSHTHLITLLYFTTPPTPPWPCHNCQLVMM